MFGLVGAQSSLCAGIEIFSTVEADGAVSEWIEGCAPRPPMFVHPGRTEGMGVQNLPSALIDTQSAVEAEGVVSERIGG